MILVTFLVAEAWAAGAEHHAPSLNELWFPLINFLIFAYIIQRYGIPVARDFVRARRQEVLSAVQSADERKRRAEALVQEYRNRLAGIDQEVQSLQSLSRAQAERERSKLLSETEAMAAKIKDDARFLGEQEVKMARQQLRRELAAQAEAEASDLIQRHISSSDQVRLAEDFIRSVGHPG